MLNELHPQHKRQQVKLKLKRTPNQSDPGKPKAPTVWVSELITGDSDLRETRTEKEACKMHSEDGGGRRQSLLQRKGNCHFLQRRLPRVTRPRHAPARPLAARPHPPAGAARPPPPGRGCSGGRRLRAEADERAAGPWRRHRPGAPGRRFPATAREARAPKFARHHLRPLAPRPHPSRRCAPPRHPPAVEPRRSRPEASARPRGDPTRRQRRQGRGAGPPYLHFPPPGCVLPVMGRHLAC